MSFDRPLHNLLEQPFGPYLEETILSDKCKFMASKRLLLGDFQLAYNDQPTGFDRTEFEGHLTPSTVAHLPPIPSGSPVLFRGILSLQALVHLTEEGQKYFNHDFKERVMRSAMNGVLGARRHSNTNLEAIFARKAKQKHVPEAEKYDIKLLIQGYMHSTASFMRSDLAPNGLLFHTANVDKTKFRIYQIVSMDVETYKLSRTFLFRHHTLRTMRDILDRAAAAGVPASQCTPQWFIDQYIGHHAYPSRSKWQRINFLEGVESSDEGFNIPSQQTSRPPDAQTHMPRHLRKVHKNEVWSIFASHSEWILSLVENHKDLKGKVNGQSWKIFLMTVPQLRERALFDQDTDGRWGIKDEKGEQTNKQLISKILSPSLFNKASQPIIPKVKKYKKKKSSIKNPISVTVDSFKAPINTSQTEDQLDNIYDSDFTQGSLSPTPCHTGSTIHPPPSSDPSLFALIPHEMFNPPTIPANLLWHCPIGGGTCSYTINLCAPSNTNLRSISTMVPQDEAIYLLEKQWKGDNEQVCMIFYEMVNAHWEDHLKELDIKHVDQGDTSTFKWIHPERHAPWPPQKWKLMKARREQLKPESPEL